MDFMGKEEEITLMSYAKIAETWNDTHSNPNFWIKEFEEFRYYVPQGRIIDIGSGGGRDALLFQEYKPLYTYIGVDASQEMILEARRLVPSAIFLKMDMYSLNFQKDFFDGFWASLSLLHIPKRRVLGIFKRKIDVVLGQIRKVVKKNGIGFIVIKEGEGEKIICDEKGNKRFFSFYSLAEFSKILTENGFEVLEAEPDFKNYNPEGNKTIWLKYFVKVKK